jgi:hypothetical protein
MPNEGEIDDRAGVERRGKAHRREMRGAAELARFGQQRLQLLRFPVGFVPPKCLCLHVREAMLIALPRIDAPNRARGRMGLTAILLHNVKQLGRSE